MARKRSGKSSKRGGAKKARKAAAGGAAVAAEPSPREPTEPREDGTLPYHAEWMHLTIGLVVLVLAGVMWLIAGARAGGFVYGLMVVMCLVSAFFAVRGFGRIKTPWPSKLDELWIPNFFLESWKAIDREALAERRARKEAGKGYDFMPLIALVSGAVFLTLMEYFGGSRTYNELLETLAAAHDGPNVWDDLRTSEYARLYDFVWWAGWRVAGYLIFPMVIIKAFGQRIRDQGLETKGFLEHAWIYAFAFGFVFVMVVIVSYTAEFSTYYPFYKLATRSWFDFLAWEALYAAQFFSLEFFFRGWWLKTLKPMMGSFAIFAMVVPYCMIHYGKPFPETMGAIVAGIALGTLAMKTRSIWSGFLIHVSVAVSMDVAALLQTTGMPTTFWPS